MRGYKRLPTVRHTVPQKLDRVTKKEIRNSCNYVVNVACLVCWEGRGGVSLLRLHSRRGPYMIVLISKSKSVSMARNSHNGPDTAHLTRSKTRTNATIVAASGHRWHSMQNRIFILARLEWRCPTTVNCLANLHSSTHLTPSVVPELRAGPYAKTLFIGESTARKRKRTCPRCCVHSHPGNPRYNPSRQGRPESWQARKLCTPSAGQWGREQDLVGSGPSA
ncbi:hypothetical protein BD289DRAFT_196855 [Coniella lustricola]|uniref:Uncharacterized protein n=1 Tax=Coniella lustricola TaxID=2025994 RepID=A0A2T3ACT4_9PEZI|nr:hypothetical protein BD289DRAFT_196855 [Coniella lustricola]